MLMKKNLKLLVPMALLLLLTWVFLGFDQCGTYQSRRQVIHSFGLLLLAIISVLSSRTGKNGFRWRNLVLHSAVWIFSAFLSFLLGQAIYLWPESLKAFFRIGC